MTEHPSDDRATLAAAAAVSTERLRETWRTLVSRGEPRPETRLAMARFLVGMNLPEQALEVLERMADTRDVLGLRALALDKRHHPGDADLALEILAGLQQRGELDGETGGILAGRYKRRARDTGDPVLLRTAMTIYRDAWESTGDTYPGINAAALALELEGRDEARAIAADVLRALDALPASSNTVWTYATRGEAHLLLDDLDSARKWYGRAVAAAPNEVQSIAVMRSQARRNLRLLGLQEGALDAVLAIRSVVALASPLPGSGESASSRFPPEAESSVRSAIRERLKTRNAGTGFSSAARGADLIFLEELLDRGGLARVTLPFPADDFERVAVGDWTDRFRRVMSDPRVQVRTLLDVMPAPEAQPQAWLDCQASIREAATQFANGLGERPELIAVRDTARDDEQCGITGVMASWTGCPTHVITPVCLVTPARRDILGLRRPTPPAETFDYDRRYCIVIGINDYSGASWPVLWNAEGDAAAVGDTLRDLHGFEVSPLPGAEATRDRIASTLIDDMAQRVAPDDLVVVYFAGHGHTQQVAGQDRGFIVPSDAQGLRLSRLIRIEELSDWSAMLECRHMLLVFDSCFSGMMVRMAGNDRRDPDPEYARLAITSGTANQTVDDGPKGGHSPFADALLRALRRGPDGTSDYFTAVELHAFLRRTLAATHRNQNPTLAMLKNHEGGEIVFRIPTAAS